MNIRSYGQSFEIEIWNKKNRQGRDASPIIESNAFLNQIQPILRPISDLYKKITHNGKEIVPIVELAKIHHPNLYWENTPYSACNHLYNFRYDDGFICSYKTQFMFVNRQYQLFDFMNELKIDYRGLIDAGLAISVHDFDYEIYK